MLETARGGANVPLVQRLRDALRIARRGAVVDGTYRPLILGDHTQGLGILRSLGRAGLRSDIVSDRWITLAGASRYAGRVYFAGRGCMGPPSPGGVVSLMRCLLEALPRGRYLAFPVNDDLVHFLDAHRARLGHRLYLPDTPLERVYDKFALFLEARKAGVPVPEARLYGDGGGHERVGAGWLVKGRRGNRFRGETRAKCLPLDTEAVKRLARTSLAANEILVQENIPGSAPVVSFCGLAQQGALKGAFMYRKLCQHPDEFGTGTLLESCAIPEVLRLGRAMVAHLRFTGIFEIEFKWSERHGSHVVLEMNPRTWKSIDFATRCGQNLVCRYLALVNGVPCRTDLDYDVGRKWVDLATYIPQELRRRRLGALVPRFDFECVWSSDDPLPFLVAIGLAPLIALRV